MTADINTSTVLQTLIVAGLLWTARTLATTIRLVTELSVTVRQHEKRLDRLEDAA